MILPEVSKLLHLFCLDLAGEEGADSQGIIGDETDGLYTLILRPTIFFWLLWTLDSLVIFAGMDFRPLAFAQPSTPGVTL